MIKKQLIYKKDKWNMMTVEVQGKTIVLREISDQWGEDSHTFIGRPAMMHWVHERFLKADYTDKMEEYDAIMAAFAEV